jgi:hypothetical protein
VLSEIVYDPVGPLLVLAGLISVLVIYGVRRRRRSSRGEPVPVAST